MSATTKLAGFVIVLAAILGVTWVVGKSWGPTVETRTHEPAESTPSAHDGHASGVKPDVAPRLVVDRAAFEPGREQMFAFEIRRGNEALTRFDREAGVQIHLIVVRNDLTRYQHLHPEVSGNSWLTKLTLPNAGEYTAFVDFEIEGVRTVLQTRLSSPGIYAPELGSAPARRTSVDGYVVELRPVGDELRFVIERNGRSVELEQYIGASGHLVALHHDDLEYQHVHPLESSTADGPVFAAELERPGTYRLFLQFKHDGVVRTTAFDLEVPG